MEVEPGVTVTVETIDLGTQAEREIAAAREAGIDPLQIALTHTRLAALIDYLVRHESPDSAQQDRRQ